MHLCWGSIHENYLTSILVLRIGNDDCPPSSVALDSGEECHYCSPTTRESLKKHCFGNGSMLDILSLMPRF